MTQFRITATAPTTYQYQSLRHFGIPIKQHIGGSFSSEQYFDTEKDAKDYLISRAEMYFESEKELNDAIENINKYKSLSLDAVTAHIVEVDEAEEKE